MAKLCKEHAAGLSRFRFAIFDGTDETRDGTSVSPAYGVRTNHREFVLSPDGDDKESIRALVTTPQSLTLPPVEEVVEAEDEEDQSCRLAPTRALARGPQLLPGAPRDSEYENSIP